MDKALISRISASILLTLLAYTSAIASTPQGTFEKTFQVSGPVDLDVQTRSGDIIVRSGEAGSVTIRGKILRWLRHKWILGRKTLFAQGR